MGTPLRVLIIEDSEDDAQLVIRELRRGGYEPAFERVETRDATNAALDAGPWNVIVADYNMPHFSGPAALKLYKEKGLDIPFIVVSGTIGEDTAVDVMLAGAHDYVMKDNLQRLVPAITRELREAEVRREYRQLSDSLKKSEEKYRSIFETSGVGILRCTPEGCFTEANPALARIHGFASPEEMLHNVTNAGSYFWVDREEYKRYLDLLGEEGEVANFEARMFRKDRSIIWISLGAKVFRDADGRPLYRQGTVKEITLRKEAEQALKESEERYRTAIESSDDGVAITREGRIVCINRRFLAMSGYDGPEEVLGTSVADARHVHPEDRERAAEVARRTQAGEATPSSYEGRTVHKDGRVLHVEASTAGIIYDGKPAFLGYLRDNTERKAAEEALSASENRYRDREVFQSVSDGFVAVAMDGRFVDANISYLAILGYSLEELLTLTIRDVTPKKWHPVDETMCRQVLERGYSDVYEKEYVRKDGRIIPIELRKQLRRDRDGNPVELWAFVRNLSQRKRIEEALQKSEEKYRSIFENAIEGIFQITPDGRLLQVNPSFSRMYGCDSPEELMNSVKNLQGQQYIHPKDLDRFRKLHQKHGFIRDFEALIYNKNNEPVWISMNARAVKDSDGQILFYEGTVNISRRKKIEMLRNRTEGKLRRQSKQLCTLSKRLSEVHEEEKRRLVRELHDGVGGNLTALGINLSMLRTQLPETLQPAVRSRLDDSLSLLMETAKRIRGVMSDLRPAVLKDYGLPAALRWYSDRFSSRTGIEVDLLGSEFNGRYDPLVENALFRIAQEAFTNVAKHAQASRVEVKWGARKGKISLAISDNGVGFSRSKVGGNDTAEGRGLLIMKEQAAAIGGRCTIGSRPEGGTRVWVEIAL